MEKGLIRVPADFCPKCKTRSLMAYDAKYDKPIYFITKNPSATTKMIMDKVNDKQIRDLVCHNCGTRYMIDYSLGFPRPITKFGLRQTFFDGYLNHNEKTKHG